LERLPVPFGLVRYGVAPDHPEVKNVENTFTQTARDERVRFVGNVAVGSDVRVAELRRLYDAVVLAYGAAKDRELGIPGENLNNVVSARNFVGWYNGLPEAADLKVDLSHESVAVVGLGNVALDVARILLTPIDFLKRTDITERALAAIAESRVKRVYIVGRRGPLHVSFTIKELREMVNLAGCRPVLDREDFVGVKEAVPSLKRPRKRLTELLAKTALDEPSEKDAERRANAEKSWHLKLLRTPLEILPGGADGRSVSGLKLGINRLVGDTVSEAQSVEDTGETEVLECGLVLRSIGYQSVRVEEGIPFDDKRGVIPNEGGRVESEPGLYCAGWLATGPRGVIVDTMTEAFQVGQNVAKDLEASGTDGSKEGHTGLTRLLSERGVKFVGFDDWEAVDGVERASGEAKGKPREKLTDVESIMSTVEKKRPASL